ncbi:hypothetical protein SAE02_78710 [Skermanella aerolata]|jgi:hypothetical protein|uniref:Uncharacterized protein n=1 Tax=Skermanella aerolata TaxID=393310 RepID=A0A512E4V0_9PROT|nr:hypothetical protein [Skermanella aerolata]KJB89875.1 hypothetical protein N826_11930 [Skermanella aerolata KACC 11604]GEO43723.1 hypothetical protein SAE02_78710 [Skermanella aerolata]
MVGLVISWRFHTKQQMQWSKKEAHLPLKTRTRSIDGTLRDLFATGYPTMPATQVRPVPLTAAA